MELVITLLEKELERQNLLIIADNTRRKQSPGIIMDGPLLAEVYPNMVQLRDQIEDAIAYLNTRK